MSPFVSACSTITAARPATKTRWSASAKARPTRPASSSAASRAAGSANVTASAKSTISRGGEPRTAKKAAFLPRMSSSGWASAEAESASRWAPDHRVFGGRELDYERGVEGAQPVEGLGDRDVAADREVVDEREAEREVGGAAGRERPPFEPPPAESRRRVCEVRRQRED